MSNNCRDVFFTETTGTALAVYSTFIGDGINTLFNVPHNLNTKDITVSLRNTQTNLLTSTQTAIVDFNNLLLTFNSVPAVSAFYLTVFAGISAKQITGFEDRVNVKITQPVQNIEVGLTEIDENIFVTPEQTSIIISPDIQAVPDVQVNVGILDGEDSVTIDIDKLIAQWGQIIGNIQDQNDLWTLLSAAGVQTLFYSESSQELTISRGNTVSLSSLKDLSLETVLNYLSTNFIEISSLSVTTNLSVGDSSSITNDLSVGRDLFVDGTLYTGNTAIVLGTYFENIGDGINDTFNVTHNLGSQDVHVVVRDLNSNLLAFPAIQPLDLNSVNISFSFVPAITSYNVSIFAGVPSNKISAYRQDVRFLPRPIANTFYVSTSGNDENSGTEISFPLRTIKKACQLAHNARVQSKNNPNIKYTVFVGTGDYYEENPIYVAPNTSLIGDNLRRVSVFPNNKQYDLFWVDNSSYIWGFTFRGHLEPAAAIAFPNYSNPALTAIALSALETPYVAPLIYKWRKPYITTSPYIQGCSSITTGVNGISAGSGMRVDGTLAEGFLRSMVLDSYTQFNEGGKGIEIINNGYAQLVSIFTICCTEGIVCKNGGVCSISNSNCSFGLSGIVAVGKSPTPVLTGTLINFIANPEDPFVTSSLVVSGIEGTIVFPDSDYYPQLLSIPNIGLDTRKIAYTPYEGLIFDVNEEPDLFTITGTPISSTPGTFTLETIERINVATIIPGSKIRFYIRSTAYASSHTFEFVGTGVQLRKAVPALGGVSTPDTEAIFTDGGVVYFTSTNHTGDFSIGKEFRVLQATGTIEGETFQRSILTLVTPLNLALE